MKIMLRAAIAALSFASIGSAYAGDGDGTAANTRFTEIPGVVAQAALQSHAPAAHGQLMQAYVTQSNRGTWLFTPDQNGGSNS